MTSDPLFLCLRIRSSIRECVIPGSDHDYFFHSTFTYALQLTPHFNHVLNEIINPSSIFLIIVFCGTFLS